MFDSKAIFPSIAIFPSYKFLNPSVFFPFSILLPVSLGAYHLSPSQASWAPVPPYSTTAHSHITDQEYEWERELFEKFPNWLTGQDLSF